MDRQYLESVLCNIKRMEQPTESALQTAGAIIALLGTDIAAAPEPTAQPAPEPYSGTAYDRAVDELKAAEKYLADGNSEFARDELKHAHAWIEQAQREVRTDAEKNKVRDLIAWHRLLQQKL